MENFDEFDVDAGQILDAPPAVRDEIGAAAARDPSFQHFDAFSFPYDYIDDSLLLRLPLTSSTGRVHPEERVFVERDILKRHYKIAALEQKHNTFLARVCLENMGLVAGKKGVTSSSHTDTKKSEVLSTVLGRMNSINKGLMRELRMPRIFKLGQAVELQNFQYEETLLNGFLGTIDKIDEWTQSGISIKLWPGQLHRLPLKQWAKRHKYIANRIIGVDKSGIRHYHAYKHAPDRRAFGVVLGRKALSADRKVIFEKPCELDYKKHVHILDLQTTRRVVFDFLDVPLPPHHDYFNGSEAGFETAPQACTALAVSKHAIAQGSKAVEKMQACQRHQTKNEKNKSLGDHKQRQAKKTQRNHQPQNRGGRSNKQK